MFVPYQLDESSNRTKNILECMSIFGLVVMHMIIIEIQLQTWIQVIVFVDVGIKLLLEIYGSW
jgi:hypothetical protein